MKTRTGRVVLHIFLLAAVAMVVVMAGGWLLERARLGATDAEVFARLERQVRGVVDVSVQALQRMSDAVARQPNLFVEAATDQAADRRLFDIVFRARSKGPEDQAITAYGVDGQPLAWTGRPSEVDPSRIGGRDPAFFAAPGPLGLRLVAIRPVVGADGRRVGSVVSERLLSTRRGIAGIAGELYTISTDLGSVALRTRTEGAGERARPDAFLIRSPSGDVMLEASVNPHELARARRTLKNVIAALLMGIAAITLLLVIGPLLDVRSRSQRTPQYTETTAGIVALLMGAWGLVMLAGRTAQEIAPVFAPTIPRAGRSLLQSPFDVVGCALVLVALVALAFDTGERWRSLTRSSRRLPAGLRASLLHVAVHLLLGIAFAVLLVAYQVSLRDALPQSGIDILHFSVHPWDLARLSIAVGLVLFHAAVLWLGVLLFRLALTIFRVPRTWRATSLVAAAWLAAFAIVATVGRTRGWPVPWTAAGLAYLAVAVAALFSRQVVPRFRHASQGLRLILAFLALLLPAVVIYPTLAEFAQKANRRTIEHSFAPEVMNQREAIKKHVANTMDQIDAVPYLAGLVEAASAQTGEAATQTAFLIWSRTDLAAHRIASAVELYSQDGALVSRFALYLPEYKWSAAQPTREQACSWDLYEYVSPFGSEQRKLLRAGRAICTRDAEGRPHVVGSIVVHAMLDYSALPFLSSQSPYYELLRPADQRQRGAMPGGDLDLAVYGWSRTPIYTSAAVSWPLDDSVFAHVYGARSPFWTSIDAGGTRYDVYFMNDRGGIYALGYPTVPLVGHFVNLAELTTLVGLAYMLLLAGSMAFNGLTGRQPASGRALLREIRASFYRKLFLAFVAVSVIPVITLAFIAQAYIGGRLRDDTESSAIKTTAVAQRVIEDYGTLQQQAANVREDTSVVDPFGTMFGDDVMVGLSRVIDQDVNVFLGAKLVATSEADLFKSQLLPTRTPADVYRAIALDRRQSYVGRERTGEFTYMLAAAPVRVGGRDYILTVPLMLRQQEIEREIDDLNRRIVLATLLFILLGAAIGYPMAERIADPVNRLTRATRRIARGEFDARIAATSSDELRRLVEAFNSMAGDLQRQREQLERTNRLEAWAEMARQVAHEIKNPLTPIQLSAEHLQRVHSDRGRPLSPVLDECVTSILSQVRLLRQISGEFSSFASSPTAKPSPVPLADLVDEVIGPYRSGLAGRIVLSEALPVSLPLVFIDRVLVGRALANIVENALHAMPGQGTLTVGARTVTERGKRWVELTIGDTGVGMDAEALGRLFEPYFSTKAIGTGLGLAIAKRNVELNGGQITVESEKGKGTAVHVRLPVADEPVGA